MVKAPDVAARYFTVHGSTPREALAEMKRRYGSDARIQSHRTVRIGGMLGLFARPAVEITGYVEGPPAGPEATSGRFDGRTGGDVAQPPASLQRLIEEFTALRARLEESLPAGSEVTVQCADHPALAALRALLAANDFAVAQQQRLIAAARTELPLAGLDDQGELHHLVARRIAAELAIAPPLEQRPEPADGPRICTVVGPTGVGKTTTVAKLAAIHALAGGAPASQVRIVTIDNYRIGARQQIETYGEIMRIPVTTAETADELKKAIALGRDADVIFIDTVGRSPGDYARMAEMRTVLDVACRHGTTMLAVSASTKFADLRQELRLFEPFGYDGVIVTKLDETGSVGNVLSALAEMRKPVSYLCDGQVVPQDIASASILRLLLRLDGFRLDRARLEDEFGAPAKPQTNSATAPTAC